jgi:hypothetical protein
MLTINQASDTRHARSTRKSPFDQVVGSLTLGNRMLCWRSQVLRYDPWKRHFPSAGGWLHVETIKGEIESRTLSEAVATYGEEVGDLMTSRGAASELTKITQIENKAISPLYDSFKLDSLRQQNIAPMKEKKRETGGVSEARLSRISIPVTSVLFPCLLGLLWGAWPAPSSHRAAPCLVRGSGPRHCGCGDVLENLRNPLEPHAKRLAKT